MTLNSSAHKTTKFLLLITGFFLVFLSNQLITSLKKEDIKVSQQEKAININEHVVKGISLGQNRLLSSLLWAETLIKAGISHYKEGDLNNWMFLRLKLMTTLDPYFYQAYLYGGIYLSIVKDDDVGAEFIYDKGLRYFSDDLYLNMNASYHYLFEVHHYDKGLSALERAEKMPNSPPHIPRLIARFKAQSGKLEDARDHLVSLMQGTPEGSEIRKKYLQQIDNIQIEIDLNCLNENKKKCNFRSPDGSAYKQNSLGKWYSQQPWESFKPKTKKAP